MELPPLDPFAGYLEVVSVIGILEAKRARLSGAEEGEAGADPDGPFLLARIENGILEAQELQRVYEERMEDVIHNVADRADMLRALFDSITSRMAEMQAWIEAAVDGLPEEDREEWDLLVSDYERIREQLGSSFPSDTDGPDFF
ncbi:MAG: hypothetical protein DVB28_000160 [Verrucomicrobia bacterium]|nr:MAG: hypothetical protein DVB28_000160 [Verrucomicrobiota bacterium]